MVLNFSPERTLKSGFINVPIIYRVGLCQWQSIMNRVFEILTPYINHIEYETKSLHSDEAVKMNLFHKCVMIDGEILSGMIYRKIALFLSDN